VVVQRRVFVIVAELMEAVVEAAVRRRQDQAHALIGSVLCPSSDGVEIGQSALDLLEYRDCIGGREEGGSLDVHHDRGGVGGDDLGLVAVVSPDQEREPGAAIHLDRPMAFVPMRPDPLAPVYLTVDDEFDAG
jgi:hypothetical protein